MVAPIHIPRALVNEEENRWNMASGTITPGQAGNGVFPRIGMNGGGLWRASISSLLPETPQHAKFFRAIRVLARGGVVPLTVPRQDSILHVSGTGALADPLPHSDGSYFSDGSGYAQSTVEANVVGDHALRATTMLIRFVSDHGLEGGESFAIEHASAGWRLYEIGTAVQQSTTDWLISFAPELRADVPGGTRIEFDDPRCLMNLITPGGMDFTMRTWPFALHAMEFIEAPY